MKPLEPFPQCIDCLMGLAHSAYSLVSGESPANQTDGETLADGETMVREILAKARKDGLNSPETANQILREIRRVTGVSDPYARSKAIEMAQAKAVFSQVKDQMGEDFRSLVTLAVLGNTLDFFKPPEEALAEIPAEIKEGPVFFRDDIPRLESFLSKSPDLVLYLADNAGEIYFDIPLYQHIRHKARRTVLVVKGGPSLNDLTRVDLRLAQLEDEFQEVIDTGTDGAGIEWRRVSREFLDLVDAADLILSKGMANLESVYPKELTSPVFFLSKIKCRPMQNYLDAPAGSFWAMWRDSAVS